MLKKSGALVLTILYIVTVLGFALNLHYCGKIITNVSINAPAKGCTSNPMSGKMKCCTDKRVDIKIKDAHQNVSQSFLAKVFSLQLSRLPFAKYFLPVQRALLENFLDRGPPDLPFNNIPRFLKNCIFRI